MRSGWRLIGSAGLGLLVALVSAGPCLAGDPGVPAWLQAHVGEGEGQIAPVVLERARALYQRKGVRNPCYFALTRRVPMTLAADWGGGSTSSAKRKARFAPSPPATAAAGIWTGKRISPTDGDA